jgi:ethanolamine utilization protein EutN
LRLARVIGPLWGARHADGLDGRKLLEVALLGAPGDLLADTGGRVVAIDALGAGPGELVLVAHGSRVRDLTVGATVPDKDVVVAIVDGVDDAPSVRA